MVESVCRTAFLPSEPIIFTIFPLILSGSIDCFLRKLFILLRSRFIRLENFFEALNNIFQTQASVC